jgi:hypothetical protein
LNSADETDHSDPCPKYCERAATAGCDDQNGDCLIKCQSGYTSYARCKDEWDAIARCGASSGQFACYIGQTYLASCTKQTQALETCMEAIKPICSELPATAASLGDCYSGQVCNPLADQCPSGQACQWQEPIETVNLWSCVDASLLTQGLCAPCDYGAGLFCKPGYACVGDGRKTCARFCCSDADCGGVPDTCINFGMTYRKFCATGA